MPKKQVPVESLKQYLPAGTFEAVMVYLQTHKVHLTVARERKSVLGDYRHRTKISQHRISVNGNLNKYSFLITLLHELAHLLTFECFGSQVSSHGREWKKTYGQILQQFLEQKVFPSDIGSELMRSLHNPAASSCAEEDLMRVLRRYDDRPLNFKLVEELLLDEMFKTSDGSVFQRKEKVRKRYKCLEPSTGKMYVFSPVYEVLPLAH